MSAKRRRLSKKEDERLEREIANQKSKARAESQARQERIRVLWDEIRSGRLTPKEKEVARELAENELVRSLTELADKQQREIKYLAQFRRDWDRIQAYYPQKLEQLSVAILIPDMRSLLAALPKQKPQAVFEDKRRIRKQPGDVGLIEWEFGGGAEAERRKSTFSGAAGEPYQPSCLDDILRGGVGEVKMQPNLWDLWGPPIPVDTVTNMRRLQFLFGIHRDRFRKKVERRRLGKIIVYDWWEVVEIMDALLSERRGPRKKSVRGRPRTLWLSDPDLRNRVLSGIEARINSISAPKEIATAFLVLVHRHRVDSAKK